MTSDGVLMRGPMNAHERLEPGIHVRWGVLHIEGMDPMLLHADDDEAAAEALVDMTNPEKERAMFDAERRRILESEDE